MGHLLLLLFSSRIAIPAHLSLSDAIDIALRSSPALQKAAATVRRSEAQEGQANSRLLPEIGIGAAETGQSVNLKILGIDPSFLPLLPSRTGPFQTVDARVGVTQSLWNTPLRDRLAASREQTRGFRYLALDARELLSFQVAVAFAQALRTQSAVETLDQQLALARKLHGTTLDRVNAGVSSKLDAKRSEIQARNIEQSLIETTNILIAQKLQLANLIHAEPSTSFVLARTGNQYPPQDTPPLRSDYRAAESTVRAAELRVAAARHERHPTATVRANFGSSGRAWNDNIGTYLIQGSLNIPIYTGGRTQSQIAEAEAQLNEAKAALEELRSQIESETLAARAALDSARRQTELALDTVKLARDELDLSTERFTSGVADNTEVVNAQERLTRAEENAVRARFNADIALAQLKRASGAKQ